MSDNKETKQAPAVEAGPTNPLLSILKDAAKWLHAAYDRPPQTPEAKAMLDLVDLAIQFTDEVSHADAEQSVEAGAEGPLIERLKLMLSGDAAFCKTSIARAALEQAIAALARASEHPNRNVLELVSALDHIVKVSKKSRSLTRRIRWIVARAEGALNGNDDWRTIELPRDDQNRRDRLQARVKELEEMLARASEVTPEIKTPDVILTGAQLLEAIDFIAPDRSAEQLEDKVAIQYGEGHSGKAYYAWCAEYPEEGAFVLDGSSARASEAAAGEPIYQARQHSDEEGTWDDVQEATYLVCAAEPRFYKTRIVYAAPQPAAPSAAAHAPGCGDGEDCNACDAMNVAAAPQPASEQQAARRLPVDDLRVIESLLVGSGYVGTMHRVRMLLAAKGDGHAD